MGQWWAGLHPDQDGLDAHILGSLLKRSFFRTQKIDLGYSLDLFVPVLDVAPFNKPLPAFYLEFGSFNLLLRKVAGLGLGAQVVTWPQVREQVFLWVNP